MTRTCCLLLWALPWLSASALAAPACSLPPRASTPSAQTPPDIADTAWLQAALDQCHSQGGGELRLPAGLYRIGPIELRSHVMLHLERGATLLGSADPQRYEAAFIGWPFRAREALIYGHGIQHAGLSGEGVIDGQGQFWWAQAVHDRQTGAMASRFPNVPDANGMPRPWLVEFSDAQDIRITGLTLRQSPMWTLVLRNSERVDIDQLTISNPTDAPNTDGIDVLSSSAVHIHDTQITTGDDDIAVKSGLGGWDAPLQPVHDVDVERLRVGGGHGLSIGSESAHPIQHVHFRDIDLQRVSNGFRIKSGRDRGSDISDITLTDVRMTDVGMALSVSAYYPHPPKSPEAAQPVGPNTPDIHDVRLQRITLTRAAAAGQFIGLPERPLRAIQMQDVHGDADSGWQQRDADVVCERINLHTQRALPPHALGGASAACAPH